MIAYWFRIMILLTAVVAPSILACSPGKTGGSSTPPRATAPYSSEQRDVTVDVYHGAKVSDPYRWMESGGQRYDQWIREQAARAAESLSTLKSRGTFRSTIARLDTQAARLVRTDVRGNQAFFSGQLPGTTGAKLYLSNLDNGTRRLLVDPERFGNDATATLEYFEPSPDGALVAFGISTSGSEDSTMRILEVKSGKLLPDEIHHGQFASPAWDVGGEALFYQRIGTAGRAETDRYRGQVVYRHVIRTASSQDRPVFGYGIVPAGENDFVWVTAVENVLLGFSVHGTDREGALYVAINDSKRDLAWKQAVAHEQGTFAYGVSRGQLYMLLRGDKGNGRIVRAPINDPAKHESVLAESERPIIDMVVNGDSLLIRWLDEGIAKLSRLSIRTGRETPIPLSEGQSVKQIAVDKGRALLEVVSWTRPAQMYQLRSSEATVSPALMLPRPGLDDLPNIVVERVSCRSADGVQIPLTMLRRSDLDSSRPQPTVLYGYGAFGDAITPYFGFTEMSWVLHGGVYAFAHIRGGGELGEAWHRAAQRETKHVSMTDYVACADELVRRGYTTPALLAAIAESGGGLSVAPAVILHPEKFAAAVLRSAVVNPVRSEARPLGQATAYEYGSVKDPREFATLLRLDAYHQVREGVRYPPILLLAGANDSRVPSWQSAKLAARLLDVGAPVLLNVDLEGGHGLIVGRDKRRDQGADLLAFFWSRLEGDRPLLQLD